MKKFLKFEFSIYAECNRLCRKARLQDEVLCDELEATQLNSQRHVICSALVHCHLSS